MRNVVGLMVAMAMVALVACSGSPVGATARTAPLTVVARTAEGRPINAPATIEEPGGGAVAGSMTLVDGRGLFLLAPGTYDVYVEWLSVLHEQVVLPSTGTTVTLTGQD